MAKTAAFWYRKKFSLTPNDPRFLDITMQEIATEYWAHHYYDNPTQEEVEDENFDLDAVLDEFERSAPDDEAWEEVELSDD